MRHASVALLAAVVSIAPARAGAVSHDLRVTLRPDARSIEVLDTVRFDGVEAARTLRFLLHEGLVPVVTTEGASIAKETAPPAPSMFLGEARPLDLPDKPRVELWRVDLPKGATAFTLRYRGVIHHPLDAQAEEYARGFQETPGIVSPDGVYLSGASWWLPWLGPEPFGFSLEVAMPVGWSAVSEGDRDLDVSTATERRVRWRPGAGEDRVEELHLIAAPFREYAGPRGRVRTMAFLRTPDDALAARYLEATGPYLEMYETLLGAYPWGKFALVENFWETGYGMPSFTLLGSKVIRLPFILASSYPHEILHNWWGNGVYVDYSRGNWCEGLTAYLADHLFQEQKGQGAAYRQETLQKYADYVTGAKDFPLSEFRERHSPSTEAIGYGKTLMFFHELRRRLGDPTFVAALRDLYATNRFRRASWADVRAAFERIAGVDLAEVFRSAVERRGAPALRLARAAARPAGDGWILAAELEQTQEGEPYRLRVPLAITMAGTSSAFETTVEMAARRATVELPLPAKPLRLDVDPDFDLFRRLDREEIPPALSMAFGAEKILAVLPSGAPPELLAAYRAMAEGWGKDRPGSMETRTDAEVAALPSDRSVWIVGWENRHLGALKEGLSRHGGSLDGTHLAAAGAGLPRAGTSGAVVVRHPGNPALVAAWVGADRAAAVPGLGRKLPHYHKYSYLGFSGEEPTNVLKGRWAVVDSPMSAVLGEDRGVAAAPRAARVPLAELPASYSNERMVGTIRMLASAELAGRGFGEPGSRLAAERIASAFREAGLAPGGEGGYLVEWTDRGGDPEREVRLANVVGVIRGTKAAWSGQSVVVGAHYDHLGDGWPDVKSGNRGKVHPGADDNASGVAVLIELARVMAASDAKPERTIVFVAFAGEEAGLRGSKRYVAGSAFPASRCIGMVNLDTVGRLGAGKILVLGAGSASEWVHIFNGAGWVTGAPIQVVADDFGSSDQRSFLDAGVPAVQLFTGPHPDYHAPTDTPDKIDAAGLAKVAAVAREAVAYLASREDPMTAAARAPAAPSPAGSGRKSSLGTVPDFAYPGPGLKLSGVGPGSPAEKAGLAAGDVVVAVDGKPVADLRAFSEILKARQPGDEVEVVWTHGAEERRARLVLAAR